MYRRIFYVDEVVDEETGERLVEGTPQSAGNFNTSEIGISDVDISIRLLALMTLLNKDQLEIEEQTITLTNTASFPFNDSLETVALIKNRNNMDYSVETEILSSAGLPGDIKIKDKLLNGFKIAYTGSAENVEVKFRVQGGM